MTLRQIIATNTHVVTTTRRFDKLSTTILLGKGLWPAGLSVSNGPDLQGLPFTEKMAALTAQHRALWEKCVLENKPLCIVEDDAWCLRTDHPALDRESLATGNVIYFLGATYPHVAAAPAGDDIVPLASGKGTHAYVITPESARVLCALEDILVVDHITDAAMRRRLTDGFLLMPGIFCQLDAPGDNGGRANFEGRHRGRLGKSVLSVDQMLGDAALIQAQMQQSLQTPWPAALDGERHPSDWRIGLDDVSVLSQIVEHLQSQCSGRPLTVLEFGPGRSTELFLRSNCIVRSFESNPDWAASLSFPPETEDRLRLQSLPLHPRETTVSELAAKTGFGYDLALVDAPSYSPKNGARDRRVTFACALQAAEVVVLHDAHSRHEQELLFEAARTSGRCIRRIDTRIGMAVLFKPGSLTL